jgi:hypothetical protein
LTVTWTGAEPPVAPFIQPSQLPARLLTSEVVIAIALGDPVLELLDAHPAIGTLISRASAAIRVTVSIVDLPLCLGASR